MMKKTLSLALISVVGLGAAASTFAFFPSEGESYKMGNEEGGGFGPMMMFMRNEDGKGGVGFDNQKKARGGDGEWKNALFGSAVQAAIVNKDYNAFVKSWNEAQSKVTAPTIEEFGVKVAISKSKKAIDDALTAENYEAFKTALSSMPTKNNDTGAINKVPTIPTQEEFRAIVAQKKWHDSMKNAIESNNYNAFIAARTAHTSVVPSKEEFNTIVEKMSTIGKGLDKRKGKIGTKIKKLLRNTLQNK